MSDDGSLIYWSHKTIHYLSHRCNEIGEISEEEGLGVSLGSERRRYRSLETSHSSSSNCRGHGNRSFENIHYYFHNNRGYHISDVGRGGSWSQETIHSYSHNQVIRFDVEGRGGYRYHTSHCCYRWNYFHVELRESQ